MTRLELREAIREHLTEWFRDLGVETHQIENSADRITDLLDLYIESQLAEKQKTIDLFTLEILTLRQELRAKNKGEK